MQRECDVAKQLSRQAGDVILRFFRKEFVVTRKSGDEPVTDADRAANEVIVSGLRQAFPEDAIIAEESPYDERRDHSHRVWWVDPLDGTKDFIRGDSGFSVLIGLVVDGIPRVGLIYHVTEKRTYMAVRGQGAFVEDKERQTPIRVSSVSELGRARLISSKSSRNERLAKVRDALGVIDDKLHASVGLKIALIAQGERDLYVNPTAHSKLWDVAAAEVLLREARGRLTNTQGQDIDYLRMDFTNHDGLLATNGFLHDAALCKLRPLLGKAISQ